MSYRASFRVPIRYRWWIWPCAIMGVVFWNGSLLLTRASTKMHEWARAGVVLGEVESHAEEKA